MQLAYELLPVMAGQDENLPTAIPKLRHCSRVYLLDEFHQEIKPQSPNQRLRTNGQTGSDKDVRPTPTKRINWSDKNVRPIWYEVIYGRRSTR
jgi:hypothetical protein